MGWLAHTLKMELFRLGRLQFEPGLLEKDIHGTTVHLKAGTRILNVHIPAGEKMDYAACLESFERSKVFFGNSFEAYMCESWLLSPVLKELLPSESNIIKFQDLYEIVEMLYGEAQPEERIFGEVRADKENYPEDTTLRKKAKEILTAGKDMGVGIGVFYRT